MMKPLRALIYRGTYRIEYACERCGEKKSVKAAPDDSTDSIAALVKFKA
jgi:hypothetical protein